jgi:predicted 3-demethylubiquinone-9 3-methyltransferase (glyoxalase superfamily)
MHAHDRRIDPSNAAGGASPAAALRKSEVYRERRRGWLKDKFGVSWQIVPIEFLEMMDGKNLAITQSMIQAMLKMKKLDLRFSKKKYEAG